jgi:hypothetical protein
VHQFTIKNPGESIISFLLELENELNLNSFSVQKQHAFEFFNSEGKKALKVSFPLNFSVPNIDHKLSDYALAFEVKGHLFCLALIQAGESVLGIINNKELQEYKVIRKYMVRKKQGKTQLKHLNTKGKSRAGSRIRLAQSEKFFEEINQKLTSWNESIANGLFVYGIATSLLPFWTNSRIPIPLDIKNIEHTRKVNWTVGLPREKELEKSIKHLYSSRISIFDPQITETVKSKLEQYLYIYS